MNELIPITGSVARHFVGSGCRNAITDMLPILEKQAAIILGDSVSVPSIVKIDEIALKPSSRDIEFPTEWKKDWLAVEFGRVISQMKKEKPGRDSSGE